MSDELHTLEAVPIFACGTWNGDAYAESDLDAMAASFGKVGFKPPLKLGHDAGQPFAKSDGMPALGWVTNLRRVGKTLYADLRDMPAKVWDAVRRKAYDRVSAEVYWDYEEAGQKHPRVLKALALLGAEIPAVTSLGALQALYDASGKPYKQYDFYGPVGMPLMDATAKAEMPEPPKKDRETVNYREAAEGGYDRCGACRFLIGPRDAKGEVVMTGCCALVGGDVATTFVCDLLELQEAFETGAVQMAAGAAGVHDYIISQEGDEWVLRSKSTGKVLGRHKTRDDAMTQERAVQANKHAAREDAVEKTYADMTVERQGDEFCVMQGGKKMVCKPTMEMAQAEMDKMMAGGKTMTLRYTVDEVEKFCPACAKNMRFLNIKEMKIEYDPVAKTYAGFNEGLCKKFAPGEGFRTRCMDSSLGANADEPGAMCNALEDWCMKAGHLASKTSQEQAAKTHSDAQDTKEEILMTAEEKQELEDLKAKVATLSVDLEAKGADLTAKGKEIEAAAVKLREYETQIAASEADRAQAAEAARKTENTAWLDGMTRADSLRMLPVEREYAAFLLDALTQPGIQVKTYTRVYKKTVDGKEEEVKEETPAAGVLKRLFESREPNTMLFKELTQGSVSDAAKAADKVEEAPASRAEALEQLTVKAKEYIAKQVEKGDTPADFRTAFRLVLEANPELKQAAYGARLETVARTAAEQAKYAQLTGAKKT